MIPYSARVSSRAQRGTSHKLVDHTSNEKAHTSTGRSLAVFAAQDGKRERGSPGLACAYRAPRDPNHYNKRNCPRREKRDCHADHAQAPHNRAGALRQCASQRREQAALLRYDVALAVNLDRDVGWRVRLIDLCVRAILTLHTNIFDFA